MQFVACKGKNGLFCFYPHSFRGRRSVISSYFQCVESNLTYNAAEMCIKEVKEMFVTSVDWVVFNINLLPLSGRSWSLSGVVR